MAQVCRECGLPFSQPCITDCSVHKENFELLGAEERLLDDLADEHYGTVATDGHGKRHYLDDDERLEGLVKTITEHKLLSIENSKLKRMIEKLESDLIYEKRKTNEAHIRGIEAALPLLRDIAATASLDISSLENLIALRRAMGVVELRVVTDE